MEVRQRRLSSNKVKQHTGRTAGEPTTVQV